jgi:hypothetical protein
MRRKSDYETVVCEHCGRRLGAITVRHLRRWHGYDGDHPINDYKAQFGLATASSREARDKIKVAKNDYWARRGQHWTRAKVLAEIRRRYQARESLRASQIPNRLLMAAGRYFGSWATAIQMASLDYDAITSRQSWTPEKVISAIHRLEADGIPLNATSIARHHGDLYKAATIFFPWSWTKALQAAGLDPLDHKLPRGRWTKKKAMVWIGQRIKKGRSLMARDAPRDLLDFTRNSLKKSWTEFVESFDVRYPGIKRRRDWSKARVLEEMQLWAAEGHRMNYKSLQREYVALLAQACKYFKSWDAARRAAGLPTDHLRSGPVPKKTKS